VHAGLGAASGLLGHGIYNFNQIMTQVPAQAAPVAHYGATALLVAASYATWRALHSTPIFSDKTVTDKTKVLLVQVGFAVSAALAGTALPLHEHHQGPHQAHRAARGAVMAVQDDPVVKARIARLKALAKPEDLARWEASAAEHNMTLQEFLENICVYMPEEAEAFEKEVGASAPGKVSQPVPAP
jgi:hypothetical protein